MPNGYITAADIKNEMMLTYQFIDHSLIDGEPSPFSKFFCAKCFGMIAHSFSTGDYEPVIRNLSAAVVDHLIAFLTYHEQYERCALLKGQKQQIERTYGEASLQASRAEYEEVIHAYRYGFDINSKWSNEREDWFEAKKNLKK